jgi:hypothetical protein
LRRADRPNLGTTTGSDDESVLAQRFDARQENVRAAANRHETAETQRAADGDGLKVAMRARSPQRSKFGITSR